MFGVLFTDQDRWLGVKCYKHNTAPSFKTGITEVTM